MLTGEQVGAINLTRRSGAVQRAKDYRDHIEWLWDEVELLRDQLKQREVDMLIARFGNYHDITPKRLEKLLALEAAVCGAGYCGVSPAEG